ncbi:Inner membrane transport permease YbhR [Oceanobacillus picturae]|uniref:Inner membrane transport permease YbhR n=1 Tax=Oceanobacillus picturae TaxID=171693 RepID=W9ALR2_9BACI|nr:ABC transporter permease [Oceanobacillus picturae]CDO03852.1 Inner membrane transport permease YbhR [Oceanobacillus picturae]
MRIKAMVTRIIKQFVHDKRTIALLIVAPILVLTLLSLVFNGKEYTPKLALVDVSAPISTALEESEAEVSNQSLSEAEEMLEEKQLDAYITLENNTPTITLEGSDPTANRATLQVIQNVISEQQQNENVAMEIDYLHGSEDMTSFNNFGPVFIGFFAFFFVFLIAGVSFLRERTTGTLERLLASPIRRWEIVVGYVVGFGFFTALQTIILAWYAIYILDMMMVGNFLYVLLISLMTAFVALTLGTLLSTFANNELQMIQFIPIVIVPQFFFSGVFNLETISDWVSWIGPYTPLYYAADALQDIMVRGYGWQEIAIDFYILLGFSLVFMLLNTLALKKHRRL